MAALPLRLPRQLWHRIWHADALAPVRFYGLYFQWPLMLAVGALAVEKLVFYGGFPLESRVSREISYFEARHDFAAGRERAALYDVRQALIESRDDVRLWQLAARISDRLHSPEAPYCWEQADRLAPGSVATEMALARAALDRQEWEMAGAALREVPPDQQGFLDYLVAAGRLAVAEDQAARARYFFEQAEAMPARDAAALVALADWHARLGSPGDRARAQALLVELAAEPGQQLGALRRLVPLEIACGNFAGARAAEARLLAAPGATFVDRLPALDLATGPAQVEATLQDLLGAAALADAPAVLDWMTAHDRAEEALIWIRQQDEAWQDDAGIGGARAHCLIALGEWTHLRDDQRDSIWPGRESSRLMLLAEASRRLGQDGDARSAWKSAVAACGDLPDFTELAGAAAGFADGGEARAQVWLALANRFPGQQWPLRELLRYEMARGDFVLAQELAEHLALLAPNDAPVNATRDLLCLLRGTATRQASADLAKLDGTTPDDPTVATAAAYSLYLDGRFDDALAALGALPSAELRAPQRAGYVGQLLAAAGPVDQAEAALRAAADQSGLLDPQKQAIGRALELVAYRRTISALLQTGDAAAAARARTSFLTREAADEPVDMIGAAVALLPDRTQAADRLARIDVASLSRVELELYEGAVLALAGPASRGTPYLELANGLPVESSLAIWNRVVTVWWDVVARRAFDPAAANGLLTAYRGLENAAPPDDFWIHDQPREMRLTRAVLQGGVLAGPVQERLEALLHHVPATPEIEAQIGYALFLQGRVEAGRQRLEVLSPSERARPEPAGYYAAILQACGETKRAQAYSLLASRTPENPKEL